MSARKKVLAVLMGGAAITVAVSLAPSASADPLFSDNENQYIGTLYSNNIQPKPGDTTTNLIAHGYLVCNVLGNHSGGYVASQIWQASNMTPNGVTYSQANTIVYAAIANLCPWRWY